jgi:hypothetical protein
MHLQVYGLSAPIILQAGPWDLFPLLFQHMPIFLEKLMNSFLFFLALFLLFFIF